MRLGLTLLLFACSGLHAQKARPFEIPLKDGEGAIAGHLRGRQEMEYQVSASGQTLTVAIAANPIRSIGLRLYDTDGAEMPLQKVGASRWIAPLPRAGAYGITVFRTQVTQGTARYRLNVMVR